MGRTHWHPSSCKVCGKSKGEVGEISQTGKCTPCAIAVMKDNVAQMEARKGPNFTKWRRAMVACAHPELLDYMRESA